MPDPFTALSVASAVVRFIDYGVKLAEKAKDAYNSTSGVLTETAHLELMTAGFRDLSRRMVDAAAIGSSPRQSPQEAELQKLVVSCRSTADDFLLLLDSSVPLVPDSWTLGELIQVVYRLKDHLTVSQTTRFCFFVDGLDEYEGSYEDVVDIIRVLASSAAIKICVSSRPWNIFQDAFGDDRNNLLVLQELTRSDINMYTVTKLDEQPRFIQLKHQSGGWESLVREVVDRAQGVFLWVALVVGELSKGIRNGDSMLDLQRRLRSLPPGLEEYFQHMFDTIDAFYSQQTAQVFLLCVHACKPIPLFAFSFFEHHGEVTVGTHIGGLNDKDARDIRQTLSRQINGRCQGLIEVVNDGRGDYSVGFLHRTVRDFLLTKDMSILLQQRAGNDFRPLSALCYAYLHMLKHSLITGIGTRADQKYCQTVLDLLCYARLVERSEHCTDLILLDNLEDLLATRVWSSSTITSQSRLPGYRAHGSRQAVSSFQAHTDSLALMIQQQMYHYVRKRLDEHPSLLRQRRHWPLLAFAIYPYPPI